ncbi:MAG TPA: hypothetical protein GXZ43_03475 [Clostridiaceae bacterium]|nr:hypothetical protein [Clostridiaceae bacterium]
MEKKDFSLEDIDYMKKAVEFVLKEYASPGKKRIEVAQATGLDSSVVGKYNRGVLAYGNMRASNFLKVFEFYINNFQNNS